MTKIYTKGAYIAPVLDLCIHCEQGFAQSAGIDGLTPIEGEWDDEVDYESLMSN